MRGKFLKYLGILCMAGCIFGSRALAAEPLVGISDELAGDASEKRYETETAAGAENTEHMQEDGVVEEKLSQMTTEEKTAQMFIVLPEALLGIDAVTAAGEMTQVAINELPVGGLIFMEQNLESPAQVQEMMKNLQVYSMDRTGLPLFTCVDEEGGSVARISGRFENVPYIGDMCEIGASRDANAALEAGRKMGTDLAELGFNVDFAPDADVLSNPDNEIVRYRSFGDDPRLVSEMALKLLDGLKESGVFGCLKHYPGHGATVGDTHEGYAYTDKTLEELRQCELVPFTDGVARGVDFIMAGHISVPQIQGDNTPASLSKVMLTDILRDELGYDGLVVTDALNMGAVAEIYSSGEAAVQAVLAGNDLILMPEDFTEAYNAVLSAVKDGTIPESRLDESVRRIIKVKQKISGLQ